MTSEPQWRAEFNAGVTFSNGGSLQAEDFRLDIPGEDIDDGELGELFVRRLGLLMVDRVTISGKKLIQEPHKGSRGVPVAAGPRRVAEICGPQTRCDTNVLAALVDLPGVVLRVLDSATTTIGATMLAPLEVSGRAVVLHTGGSCTLTGDGADWLIAHEAALVAIDATQIGPAGTVLHAAGIPVLTGVPAWTCCRPGGSGCTLSPSPLTTAPPWAGRGRPAPTRSSTAIKTLRGTTMSMEKTSERRRLIIVGDGPKEQWEPVFAAVAGDHELVLVSPGYPSWQAKYVRKHRIANIQQYLALHGAIADLRGEVAEAAVLTWEERSVAPVAAAARKLRMRFMAPDAVRALPPAPWRSRTAPP